MKNFVYNISTKVFFGDNALDNIGLEVSRYSKRILITFGSDRIKKSGLFARITNNLKEHGVEFFELGGIKANPSIKSVREGIEIIKNQNIDFILAVGGGSVIDATKGMAVGAAQGVDPWVLCKREAYVVSALPIASVLTLAATGSEMNGNAVLSNEETGEKLSFGSDLCRPVFSCLDPTLTYSVPKDQTGAGVVDIFAHSCELYFEHVDTNYIADRMTESVMKTCVRYGRLAIDEPQNYEARANLMWASSLALNSLLTYGKTGGDWASHGIEHELSAVYDMTHGMGLAIVLPQWLRYVLNESTVDRVAMFAQNVWGIVMDDKFEQARAGIDAMADFFKSLDLPAKLGEMGIDGGKIDHMASQAVQFGEIGAFRKLDGFDVAQILKMCL